MRITPSFRPPEPPHGPSLSDTARRWEESEEFACAYCDSAFDGKVVRAEADHIIPLARGGVHEWFNLAPACQDCNRLKSDLDWGSWLQVLREWTAT
ncbi:HNH endonuclease [Streptomyces sp. NPDC091376]|uniref:HNH endonuclease n=1 Tax=Streptomyces sp. NPDC091376 TaxID=3365994 RepID=UPI00382CACFB